MHTEFTLAKRAQERADFLATLTVTTGSPYASGDILGSPITINRAGMDESWLSAILQSIAIFDPSGQAPAMDLFFFNSPLTATYTNKTAFAPSSADMQNCIGVAHVVTGDYVAAGASLSMAGGSNQSNLGRVMKPGVAGATNLYCIAVSRGTPSLNVGSIYLRFQFSNGL